ncbi:hypothetical protein CO153_02170, partial [Candidatus Pacearchaeota archaeon CG_4_9_14_3_um_filter_30_11]
GKDYTCYIVFNRLEGNEKKFLSEAINIEGLVTIIEKEIKSINQGSFKNLNIEYPLNKGHYFHEATNRTYEYSEIWKESIKKISKKLIHFNKK